MSSEYTGLRTGLDNEMDIGNVGNLEDDVVFEPFTWTSNRSILRLLCMFCALSSFALIASDNFRNLSEAKNLLMISLWALVFQIGAQAFDLMDIRRSYMSLWPLTEFACNFMFMIVSFCGAIALLSLCYWNQRGEGFCDYSLDGKDKATSSAIFSLLLSFCLVPSTIISYKKVKRYP
uniref:MARVEL domain-containing protein n=1 Tax=Lotharella oceanica TaxID=641309 RepID=A0A7S2XHF8_9EUKA|mmetsp:Transcript_810/g.1491  ORF Transcript_810/g.1491 Transcript_810/m.1491 type:complete len:177 (+) Transcript_810:37-567(+)|eukprot:CAMPEP_0170166952 /NCGR_PEP_ID=MMETSP0040_2-20121228/485_1 /TAXON_ID=641309 /ORGANISM="Lotharella oceanica, Strain CCMP622" /LENGTH=176 /DNA_ID=CAMNT_0010404815 /DNA_START=28 /DNA_END=558 /DNA_ORIENTATION=-